MAFVKHYFICNPQIKTADMKGFWLEKHPTIEYPKRAGEFLDNQGQAGFDQAISLIFPFRS